MGLFEYKNFGFGWGFLGQQKWQMLDDTAQHNRLQWCCQMCVSKITARKIQTLFSSIFSTTNQAAFSKCKNPHTRWKSLNFPYHITTPTRRNPPGPDGSVVVPAAPTVRRLWGTRGAGGCDEHKSKWHHHPLLAPGSTSVTRTAAFSFSQSTAKSGPRYFCVSLPLTPTPAPACARVCSSIWLWSIETAN